MRLLARIVAVAIFAALLAPGPGRAAGAGEAMVYRIELAGGQQILARTPPVPRATRLVFARYPDGALMSLKRSDIERVVSVPVPKTAVVRKSRPGELIVLGPTGERGTGTAGSQAPGTTRPGEAADGKALFNPARDYRPDWDSKQIPGQNLAFPASANDYREGRSFAYPPGTAVQTAPGQPPTGVRSGEPPKSPQ
ncbi:MAG: hypothetical protein DMF54_06030 [Acidobacteria bacterium]|nr:MAG: hypothetical protein DMF55_07085 [Acidobacteriota bacterium]PYQ67025.1 MAG: hypothetical protein DMF54_06030 [Acidobacteriota bacterium]